MLRRRRLILVAAALAGCQALAGVDDITVEPSPPEATEAGIASYAGEYLPIWDEVERQTTGGRGSAGDLVRAVRTLTQDLHTQLLLRLARHYQARRDGPQAIPLLEEVLRTRPEREDVAQLLIAEYRDTGQTMRARQLETTYRPEAAGRSRTE